MLDVPIKINGINIISFNHREKTVEFEVLFDRYKTIKNIRLDNPAQISYGLILEIRRKIKQVNTRFKDDALEDNVNVIIKNEEEATQKIYSFLNKVAEKVNAVKNTTTAINYLDTLNKVKNLKLVL
jgi:hypothetical protein